MAKPATAETNSIRGFNVERITREVIGAVVPGTDLSDYSEIEAAFLLIARQPEKGRYEFLDCIVTVDYQEPDKS